MTSLCKSSQKRRKFYFEQSLTYGGVPYEGSKFRLLKVIDEAYLEVRIEYGSSFHGERLVCVIDEMNEIYDRPRAKRMENGPSKISD